MRQRMWGLAQRARLVVGWRGAALLVFALLDLIYGYSLWDLPAGYEELPQYVYLGHLAPLTVWASAWFAVALACLTGAFMRRDAFAFTCAIAIKIMWGLVFALGQVYRQVPRGYVSAAIFGALAVLVFLIARIPEARAQWSKARSLR